MSLKLCAIYNCWDGIELLRGSMLSVQSGVDLFIIVYQTKSNFGELYNPGPDMDLSGFPNVILHEYVPGPNFGRTNEREKRNIGLQVAKENNCTHFLHMDCDEYYVDFQKAKNEFFESGHDGSVCEILTYFQKPTLRFKNKDNYFVPFIHKLFATTQSGVRGYKYPFYVDNTRTINSQNVILVSELMHHFSYVRKDIEKKVRNSSAKFNIEKSQLIQDYKRELKAGDFIKDFNQELIEVENQFKINL